MFDKVFVIHRNKDTDRDKYIKDLQIKLDYKEFVIVEPLPIAEDYSSYICMWSKNIQARRAVISLYNTNIKLLQRIIDEKLDNVLILEDDAVIHDIKELDKDALIHFLYHTRYKNKYIGCLANYYPLWQNTKKLLDKLMQYKSVKKSRHRAWDIELDYMKSKYSLNFSYDNYFTHPQNKSTLGNDSYNKGISPFKPL